MAEKLKDYLDNYKGSSQVDVEYVTKANYEDALNWHLSEIEKLLGGSGETPDDFDYIDKLNWHLLTIEELLKNGGGGGGEELKERVEKLETNNALWVLDTLNLNVTETLDSDKLAVLADNASHIAIWVSKASLCFRFYGEDSSNYYFTAERKDVNSYYYSIAITKNGGVASLTRDSHYYLGQVSREGGSIPSSSAVFSLLGNYTAMATRVRVRDTSSSYLYTLLRQETIDNVVHDILVTQQYSDNDELKYLYLDINTETGAYTVEEKTAGGGSSADLLIKTTYADLVAARNEGRLVPGASYQITDYQTIINQNYFSTAGNQFDIIVFAKATDKLDECAKAAHHESDESGYVDYFANCNLDSWKIWYCLDNDTSRFSFANTDTGKGVIYRMVDEWNNDCPYDFKNVKTTSGSYVVYAFTYVTNNIVYDASLDGKTAGCYNNTIKPYIDRNTKIQKIPSTSAFINNSSVLNCHDNLIGYNSSITLRQGCCYNIIGDNVTSTTLGLSCEKNIIGTTNSGINLGNYSSSNSIGNDNGQITTGMSCGRNIIGNNCTGITLANGCSDNTFNNFCVNIKLGESCWSNRFGNNCQLIWFANSATSTQMLSYCRNNTFDDYCTQLLLYSTDTSASTNNQLQNVHVHKMVTKGDGTFINIEVPDRNLTYELDYYLDEDKNLVSYINNQSSGGGSVTLYKHRIDFERGGAGISAFFEMISSSATPITTTADLAAYCYAQGYKDYEKGWYPVAWGGGHSNRSFNQMRINNSSGKLYIDEFCLYSADGTTLTMGYHTANISVDAANNSLSISNASSYDYTTYLQVNSDTVTVL